MSFCALAVKGLNSVPEALVRFGHIQHLNHSMKTELYYITHPFCRFLAYHHVNCRFKTFLLDSVAERQEVGFTALEVRHYGKGDGQKTTAKDNF